MPVTPAENAHRRYTRLISESQKRLGWTQFAPFLRLRGRWLEQAGFAIGDDVEVVVEPGRLIITPTAPRGKRRGRRR